MPFPRVCNITPKLIYVILKEEPKMRKNLKTLLICLMAIVCVASLFLVSCEKNPEPTPVNKYTVTLMVNGNAWKQEEVDEGGTYTPATPTRDGYRFDGWYAAEDFSGESVVVLTVNANTTLYSKWIALTKVNLVLDGGQLSQTTIYVEDGESIYNAVSELVPTKTNAQFDEWYNGNTALKANVKADGTEITLTAQYKYKYVIEVYEQNMEQTEYVAAQPFEGYAKVGETVKAATVVVDRAGFIRVTDGDNAAELVVSADVNQNTLKVYFDRKTINVTFQFDYPEGYEYTTLPESTSVQVVYGASVSMPTDYTCEGYYLYGWCTTSDVNTVYKTNYIKNHLYNAPVDTAVAPDTFVPTEDVILIPVWAEGYSDMFGGSDQIYVFDKTGDVCYLQRGSYFFKGEFDKKDNSFLFEINDDNVIAGKINDEHVIFMYSDAALNGLSAVYYSYSTGVNQNTTIMFNGYNEITYTEQIDGVDAISKGEFFIDPDTGLYEVTFTSGEREGTKMVFTLGTLSTGGYAFLVRNDDYKYGTLVRFAMTDNGISYYTSAYFIVFNGFGTCAYYSSSTSYTTYICMQTGDEEYTLYSSTGSVAGVIKIATIEFSGTSVTGYYLKAYNAEMVFESEDGVKLVVDEYGFATYTAKDGKSVKGYFSTVSSIYYGTLVKFISETGTEVHLFAFEYDEDSGKYTLTAEKNVNYAEYYYQDEKSIYYAPLMVLNDPADGKAVMYGYTSTKEFVKVSEGSYTYDSALGRYTYVAETIYNDYAIYVQADAEAGVEGVDGVIISPYDYRTIKSIVFATAVASSQYNVNYWYAYTTTDGETVDRTVTYTCTEGDKVSKIVKVDGYVSYVNPYGVSFSGTMTTQNDVTVLTLVVNGSTGYLYVELNDEDLTFVTYVTAPYSAYEMGTDGTATGYKYMTFAGKDYSATYTVILSVDEETNEITEQKVYYGTYSVLTDANGNVVTDISGLTVYKFVGATKSEDGEDAESIEFTFIQFATSSYYIFSKANTTAKTEYYTADNKTSLKLDGYGYGAEYMVSGEDGFVVQGMYYFIDDATICLIVSTTSGSSYYFYFDIQTDGTITVRGSEYRTYLYIDNNRLSAYIDFDGYDKFTLYTYEYADDSDEATKVVIGEGTYVIGEDTVVLTYNTEAGTQVVIEGLFGYYSYDSSYYYAFYRQYGEVKGSFVSDEDWSVLVLDGFGFATRYLANGEKETGTYALITSNVLYYCNSDEDDACIYVYDVLTGKATSCQYTGKNYFASNLESLSFSKYGFAYFAGTERLYYTLDDEGNVILYHYDPDNADANAYGYVIETGFGKFSDVVTYGNETYYTNSGYALTFTRKSDSASDYPVNVSTDNGKVKCALGTLTFAPTGSVEFSVSGQVTLINASAGVSVTLSCTVVREYVDDELVTYVEASGYKWYIDIEFKGEEKSEYNVEAFQYEVQMTSYAWTQNMMYLIYMMFGYDMPDSVYGPITFHMEYDKEGNVTKQTLTTGFYATSGYTIAEQLIELKDVDFTIDKKGTYTVEYKGADNVDYLIHIIPTSNPYTGASVYLLAGVTRVQTLDCGDYKIKLERTVWGEYFAENSVYNFVIIDKDGNEIDYTYILQDEEDANSYSYIVLEEDEKNLITKTMVYSVNFTDTDTEEEGFRFFKSATVSVKEGTTIYDTTERYFIMLDGDGNVILCQVKIEEDAGVYRTDDTVYFGDTNSYFFRSGSVYFVGDVTKGAEGKKDTVAITILVGLADATGKNVLYVGYDDLKNVPYVLIDNVVYSTSDVKYDSLSETYRITVNSLDYFVDFVEEGEDVYARFTCVTYIYSENKAQWIAFDLDGNVVAFTCENRIFVPTAVTVSEKEDGSVVYTLTTESGSYTAVVSASGTVEIKATV